MSGTELNTDSNVTTPYDVSQTTISDGYGNIWASVIPNSAGDRVGVDSWPLKGVPQQFNGTVGTSPITVTPANTTTAILIKSPPANNASSLLKVSFDDGTTFFDIERSGVLSIETEISSFQIKGSSLNIAYQIIITHK
jgi:hypothetical protein